MSLVFSERNLQEAFKLALAVTLFYWLAFLMNWDMPKYGGMAIAMICLDTRGASLQKGLMRVAGCLAGLGLGFTALAFLIQDRWGYLLFQAACYVVIGYFMQRSRYGYAWYMAAYVPSIIWAVALANPQNAFHYATFRFLETTAGVLIYTMVSALVWPRNAGDKLDRQGAELWESLRRLFGLYREQATGGGTAAGAAELRTSLAGRAAQMFATLQAAYADSPRVMMQKGEWEALKVNLRVLGDAMELWRQGMGDCAGLDVQRLAPGFGVGLESIDRRLARIAGLWEARRGSGPDGEPGDDAELLESLEFKLDASACAGLPGFDRAALFCAVQQMNILDRSSREVLRSMRVLAGLDRSRRPRARARPRDPFTPSLWQPELLLRALFPALCFIVGYLFWIYADPPTGPLVPVIAGVLSASMVLTGLDPAKILGWMLVLLWAVVAPVYCFIMPALSGGFGLLSLLFIYTFVFAALGGRVPALRFLPLLLLVIIADISNHQVFSFMKLVNGGLMFVLGIGCIVLVEMLCPLRPEKVLLRSVRRFFRGCARVMEGFSLQGPGTRERARKLRKGYYLSTVLPLPGRLRALAGRLPYEDFPGNGPDKVERMLCGMQSVAFRLEAVELAFNRASARFPGPMESRNPLKNGAGAPLARTFYRWALLREGDFSLQGREALQEMDRRIRELQRGGEERGAPELHALLGSYRGLLQAMAETRESLLAMDWEEWAASRF